MTGGVSAGDVVADLSFDIAQKTAGADAEQIRRQPVASKFLAHQHLPTDRILGRHITSETGKVALTPSFPVDVLIQSLPACIAT